MPVMQPMEVWSNSRRQALSETEGFSSHGELGDSPSSQQEKRVHRVEYVLWTPQLFREEGRGDPPGVTQRGHAADPNLSFDAKMVSFVPASWRDRRTLRLHVCITLHSMSDNYLKIFTLSICPKLPFHLTSQQSFLFSLCSCHSCKAH